MFVQKIPEAKLIGIMFLISWIIYLILFFTVKANRQSGKPKAGMIWGLLATAASDILLFFKFFDNFVYLNPGMQGLLYAFLLPAAMLILVMVETYINVSIYQHKQKKEAKEQEKLRKKESKLKKYESAPAPEAKEPEEEKVLEESAK